jgi:SPP1 family predicted phage head-tail adaptor
MEPPAFGETDFSEDFCNGKGAFAKVVTVFYGDRVWNEVNQADEDVTITHEVFIRHDDDVTAETWVELEDGTLLRVVSTDSYDERKEWIMMACTKRGDRDKGAARA